MRRSRLLIRWRPSAGSRDCHSHHAPSAGSAPRVAPWLSTAKHKSLAAVFTTDGGKGYLAFCTHQSLPLSVSPPPVAHDILFALVHCTIKKKKLKIVVGIFHLPCSKALYRRVSFHDHHTFKRKRWLVVETLSPFECKPVQRV